MIIPYPISMISTVFSVSSHQTTWNGWFITSGRLGMIPGSPPDTYGAIRRAIHDTTFRGDYRKFEKLYRDMVKEMLYEPETKKMLIDQAVNVAAHEIRRKAIPGLFDALMKGKQENE